MGSVNVVSGGLDVQSIVDQLMQIEHQPVDQMQSQTTVLQNKVSAFQTLNTKVSTLLDKVNNILNNGDTAAPPAYGFQDRLAQSIFARRKVTSSNDSIVSATAGSGTASGTYAITVSSLAKAKTMASANFADADTTTAGTGTLVIQTSTGSPVTITIDSSNNTLAGIRNAINSANAGVTATIINDGSSSPYRLLVTANETGTANAFTITDNLAGGTALGFAQTQAAADAQFTVNSISITKSTNSVDDVIDGATINLNALTSSPVNLTFTNDIDGAVSAIEDFATAYNDLNTFTNAQFAYNSTTKSAGLLSGDPTLRNIQSWLQGILVQSVSNPFTSYGVITQVGLNINGDGSITVDEAKLRDLLSSDYSGVAALFLGNGTPGSDAYGTVTDSRVTYGGDTSSTQPGTYDIQVSALGEQASVVGANSFTQLNQDETLTITHDSTVTTVNLLQNDDFATVISKINGALSANGDSVTATDDGTGRIKITSGNYGSAESISVASSVAGNPANSTGFSDSPAGTGADVAGTINGHAAVGNGLTLTGASGQTEEGLRLTIAQTVTGSYGSVTVHPAVAADDGGGIIASLSSALDGITDPLEGPIHSATDSLNSNISLINDEISQYEDRLAVKREQLTEEYSRADQALRLMNVTLSSLSSQTASLSNLGTTGA